MRLTLAFLLSVCLSVLGIGQTNLLKDARPEIPRGWKSDLQSLQAVPGAGAWTAFGSTEIRDVESRPTFITRNGGQFSQDVSVDRSNIGKYALLIGFGSSNRVFADNDITDHPYLYAYAMDSPGRIVAYLQGQHMLWESKAKNEWKCLYGVFVIPDKTSQMRFFLDSAQRNGTEHDGSESRIANPGLFVFASSAEADGFAAKYCSGQGN